MMLINTNILVAAILTTGLIGIVMIMVQRKMHFEPVLFYVSILSALPLSFLINTFVKIPILYVSGFSAKANNGSLTLLDAILWALWVGFTEEGIKFVLFLLILTIVESRKEERSTIIAYCVGIGFGIGELWYLGWSYIFPSNNNLLGVGLLSWLSGFGFERFFTTFTHAAIFMVMLYGYRKNKMAMYEALGVAMVIHALVDFPILLNVIGVIGPFALSLTVFLELLCGLIVSFYLLDYFARTKVDNQREVKKQALLQRAQILSKNTKEHG